MRQLHLFLILALGDGLYASVGRFDLTWINLIMAQTRDIPASVNLITGKISTCEAEWDPRPGQKHTNHHIDCY